MLKSDEASSYYHPSSPSTESDSFSENSKSIDTVSKLFSSLLKTTESTLNTDKFPSPIKTVPNDVPPTCDDYRATNLSSGETKISALSIPKETPDFNMTANLAATLPDVDAVISKTKRALAASTETIIIDRQKCTSTPFNSKIPVLHQRSDPLSYEDDHQSSLWHRRLFAGLKPVNSCSLKKICSNSKIPVSTQRPYRKPLLQRNEPCTPFVQSQSYYRRPPLTADGDHRSSTVNRNDKCIASSGRYSHVKSKLAAYIHRPTKVDLAKGVRSKSPSDHRVKPDNAYCSVSGIKRINSRTSLDTYTCESKAFLSEFNWSDCAKSEDLSRNYQKAREHFELAIEHNKIKMENERIVAEHRRIVTKHRQLMLEHEEKANEHTLKAIAHVLNRIT